MERKTRPNALLVELVIVLLFFSLAVTVILQLYIGAHDKSVRAELDSLAVLQAEDFSERFAASALDARAFLDADGFALREGARVKEVALEAGTLTLTVELSLETSRTGTLDVLALSVHAGERAVLTLPVLRYRPGEVSR